MQAQPPPFIGPYKIQAELGRGGMGVVYRGIDPAIGREVAVKIIRLDQFATAEEAAHLRLRLSREAAAGGCLSHPGIVTVYQLGEHENVVYIAMEFIAGASLESLLKTRPFNDVGETIGLLEQVADALDHAHSMGIVHRDVKPANILVRDNGKVKITDFGIAKIRSEDITQAGAILGTPEYMAPEQIMASQVDGKADQFSLAVMAFLMLTGKRPFEAPTANALIFQIVNAEPLLLHEVNNRMPAAATEVLRKALAKSSEGRFPTCREFVSELSRALLGTGAACSVRVAGGQIKPSRLVSRNILATGAAATAVIAAAGLLLWSRHPEKGPHADVRVPPAALVKSGNSTAAELVNAKDGLTYVMIPEGSFTMGCDQGTCRPDTVPVHGVTISKPFYLSKTEVTSEAYDKFAGTSSGEGQKPAANVSWDDARDYCEWAGGRLPTEAEWEHAARGSERKSPLGETAWYRSNSGGKVRAAATKAPNRAGVHDMQGNVWEWIADWYGPFYYRMSPNLDPPGPSRGSERVLRGGSALSEADHAHVYARWALSPGMTDSTIGFRCALDGAAR